MLNDVADVDDGCAALEPDLLGEALVIGEIERRRERRSSTISPGIVCLCTACFTGRW